MIKQTQLPLHAASTAIYASAKSILPQADALKLKPSFLPTGEIVLGNLLIFSENQYSRLIQGRFGVPKPYKFIVSPYPFMRAILSLWKVGSLYKSDDVKSVAPILLQASLEAICTYMNHHKYISQIFEGEKISNILIGISNSDIRLMIYYDEIMGWKVDHYDDQTTISASLFFKNYEITRDAVLGLSNSWIGLSTGIIILEGRIPLMDKFGYVARLVQKEVPILK